MTITPARLLRLFPRFWRERYGDEFLALLESTHLTRRHVIDVVRAAAGEWLVRTLSGRVLIALGLSTAATACALALQALVTTPPTITHDGGGTLIAPPWPVTLGFARGLLIFAGVGRWVSAWFAGAPRVGIARIQSVAAGAVPRRHRFAVGNSRCAGRHWHRSRFTV